MTLGNLVAIQQKNVKRLLAYSSIGQAGYVIAGMAPSRRAGHRRAGHPRHAPAPGRVLRANLAVFGGFIAFQVLRNGREQMTDMAGFARQAPFAALAMMCGLFSLAGMPLRRLRDQVLPLRRHRPGGAAVAGGDRGDQQHHLPLLLPAAGTPDVRAHPAGVRRGEVNGHGHAALQAATPAPVPALAVPAGASGAVAVGAMPSSAGARRRRRQQRRRRAQRLRAQRVRPAVRRPCSWGQLAGADAHGHAVDAGHGDGHGGGHGDDAPAGPWWRRNITGDMPQERSYPPLAVPFSITLGLVIFLVGVFFVGLWPAP